MLSKPTRLFALPQLWSENDQYHISTEAHWSRRVPDEHPCTIQPMHQHIRMTFSSQCATNIYTSHVRKDKWMLIQIYMYPDTITGRWMLHNCSCWNGKLCPGLIINAQYNLSAFKMSWLQKYIYIWLRGTSLEIHKCRLLFCSLTCVFTRICSEWNVTMDEWSLRCDRIQFAFSDMPKSKKARLAGSCIPQIWFSNILFS